MLQKSSNFVLFKDRLHCHENATLYLKKLENTHAQINFLKEYLFVSLFLFLCLQ